jgi:dUTP pyrophosphatase
VSHKNDSSMPAVGVDRLPHAEGLPDLCIMTPGASGYDLRAAVQAPQTLAPGKVALVPTGFRLEIPVGYEAQVRSRSGLAARFQVGVLNSPGTIDSDYRGEIQVLVYNFGDAPFHIERGDRIAQMVFARVHHPELQVRDLSHTERAAGGFGSTGSR